MLLLRKEGKFNDQKPDLRKKIEEISREIFQLKVLFATGMLSLLIQIIQIFIKK